MKKHDHLYFIAIIPPNPLKKELQLLKAEFSSTYKCKAALKSPPHITLHMPFRFPEKKEAQLIDRLQKHESTAVFEICLNDFGSYAPRVIYINVALSSSIGSLFERVQKTMKMMAVFNAGYKNRGFNPHLTIAFRDLRKSIFPAAWENFKEKRFDAKFMVNNYCLLKHNGKFWEEYKEISLI